MDNPLSQLALDYWYKVVMVVCVIIFMLIGSGHLPEFPTAPTALISIGGFFIGLGEWINHPFQTIVIQRDAFTRDILEGHLRRNSQLGICLDVFGVLLVLAGIYKML